jgi:hypothetical protein
MSDVRKQMTDDGYRVSSLEVRLCLYRPRSGPQNRKKYNGVEDEDEPKDEQNPHPAT